VLGDQLGRLGEVAGSEGVLDRLRDQTGFDVPGSRPPVKLRDEIAIVTGELELEDLLEEVVVAVPLSLRIQGKEEEICPFDLA